METNSRGTLAVVLSNPPLTDGQRTLHRVQLAAALLGFEETTVANIFSLPSHSTRGISTLGTTEDGWIAARAPLLASFDVSAGVLLAYGATAPTGPARHNFRAQVDWVHVQLRARVLPTWRVGDGPRHPSRWQRWTFRAHPNLPFPDALRASLVRDPVGEARR